MKTLYLWDGSAFVYRSFFALPPLTTKDGFPTGAIYGFFKAIFALIKSESPKYFVIAFDHPAPTQREKVYSEYKARRPKMPDPLKLQIIKIKELLPLTGINLLEKEGYEADDLIGSITEKALQLGFYVKIYSPDKDILQLVRDGEVVVINPINGESFDEKKVLEKFSVEPSLIPDYLALVGDRVDSIEGVKGVGPKTAVRLLKAYKSVENILGNWEIFKEEFPSADREKLELSYYLVKLHYVDLNINDELLKIRHPRLEELKRAFQELEFKSLVKELDTLFKVSVQKSLF